MARDFTVVYWLSRLTKKAVIGISGGKDSVAALELCQQHGIQTFGYFLYHVPGLCVEDEYLEMLEARYHTPIIRWPHPDRASAFTEGVYCTQHEMPKLQHRDIWDAARKHYGVEWLVTGEKKRDSLERRAQMVSWGNLQPARHRAHVLAEWSDKEVLAFLAERNIPLSPQYALNGGKAFNGVLDGKVLVILHDHFPADYERVLHEFPLAEAARIRYLDQKARGVAK